MNPTYEQRKLAGVCTRCGKAPATEDSLLCADHLADARRRVARAMRKRRKFFGGKKKHRCVECGRPSGGQRYCMAHRLRDSLRHQKPKKAPVNNPVNNDEKISARTWKDAGNRSRYHGQETRGRQSNAALDEQDLRYALDAIAKADSGRRRARAPENAHLSKADRLAADRAWLSQLDHGSRFIEEILDRNHYSANMVRMAPSANRRSR